MTPIPAILLSTLICYCSLPAGTERRWAILCVLYIGAAAAFLFTLGDTGTITKYLGVYTRDTAAFVFAMSAGYFTALYLAGYHQWRKALVPLCLGLYFTVDVAANALYRRTEYVYDFQRMLRESVHLGHMIGLFCMAMVAIYAIVESRQRR